MCVELWFVCVVCILMKLLTVNDDIIGRKYSIGIFINMSLLVFVDGTHDQHRYCIN
jgi:hypothetical protein